MQEKLEGINTSAYEHLFSIKFFKLPSFVLVKIRNNKSITKEGKVSKRDTKSQKETIKEKT